MNAGFFDTGLETRFKKILREETGWSISPAARIGMPLSPTLLWVVGRESSILTASTWFEGRGLRGRTSRVDERC
jgi:hypothetical protein